MDLINDVESNGVLRLIVSIAGIGLILTMLIIYQVFVVVSENYETSSNENNNLTGGSRDDGTIDSWDPKMMMKLGKSHDNKS
ncbi:hypothetical protein COU60_04880 [Candidatus Pacearchaeota archaeon CG10_big_fil_rev_8_21_14_0_10_34_76]|nr:MAG: hypothetical protein COU60_04880 [Candidatus Pacearchaeota archaeon CG10_big_fil_rev_8_21_14_0_10_34_76]